MSFVDKSPRSTSEQEDYKTLALQKTVIRGREILTYTPFRLAHSAYHTLSPWQEVIGLAALLALFYAIVVEVIHQDSFLLVVAIGLLTFLYLAHLVISVVLAIAAVSRSADVNDRGVTRKDALTHKGDWPTYTILCPLYKEARVVKQFIRAMMNLDYPIDKLQILLLVEEDDLETRGLLSSLHLPQHFSIVTVPAGSPRTKPRACNYGLLKATGAYVVIYDAEDIPEPWQLKMAALTFARGDANLACVQAQLNTYNPRQNILTRLFTLEYSLWFDIVLPGLTRLGAAIPLGGTSNHFRADVLRALGAWDAYNVTEDADLGMRLSQYDFTVKMIESTTYEEATSRIGNWIRQRSRWIKGYIQTYFVQWRRPEKLPRKRMVLLHFTIGTTVLFFLLNPVMWILTGIYILDRTQVEGLYHVLFPTPVLYAGMFCLIFGNVFYVYVAIIAAMRREQYSLVKWCLLLPFYWALIFVAAVKAVFQLVVKPHYWEKTEHGSHLAMSAVRRYEGMEGMVITEEDTRLVPIVEIVDKAAIPRLTQVVKAVKAPEKPGRKDVTSRRKQKREIDPWLALTIGTAVICSVAALIYFYSQHEILLYADAYSHLRIARSVIDSLTPGIAQIGSIWLPLPHLLMLPFIWNDTLWQTGLAGSFVSMPCYIIAAGFIFLSIRRLSNKSIAAFIGALVFILNPNVLYLQTTPLSELVCIATFTAACYFLLRWVQEQDTRSLVIAGCSTFLATMARYDGWALFLGAFILVILVGLLQKIPRKQIEANILFFSLIGGLGIMLWFLWNFMIFGDPLYFQRGPYSSQQQQLLAFHGHAVFTYHNIWQSIQLYTIATEQTLGLVIFVIALAGLAGWIALRGLQPDMLGSLLLLLPFSFYIYSFFSGQVILYIPGILPPHAQYQFFNVRFGTEMVAPAAIFIGACFGYWRVPRRKERWVRTAMCLLVLIGIIAQSALLFSRGIITLQDGQYGASCLPYHPVVGYLAQHYNGGHILEDVYSADFDVTEADIHFNNVVYEGSNIYWQQALRDPISNVDWVIVNPQNSHDMVTQHLNISNPLFLSHFSLVVQEKTGLQLYHHTNRPPLPDRPLSSDLAAIHRQCGNS